jgi:hypothetical protein
VLRPNCEREFCCSGSELYLSAEQVLDEHNTLNPWDWSLIDYMVARFVFMDKLIHDSDKKIGKEIC